MMQKIKLHFRTIKGKLLIFFAVPIIFVILVGLFSYAKAKEAILSNYRAATEQNLAMTADYIEYGFKNVMKTTADFLNDTNMIAYLSGNMSNDRARQTRYYNDQVIAIATRNMADTFFSNIYLLSNMPSISTTNISVEGFFDKYKETEQGKLVIADRYSYHWVGAASLIDETFGVGVNKYGIRCIKQFYNLDALIAVDIEPDTITRILNKADYGDGAIVSFISQDGVELLRDGRFQTRISYTDFYNMARESNNTSGYIDQVVFNGQSYMFVFAKVPTADAMVVSLIPMVEVTNNIESIKMIAIFLVLAATATATAIALYVAKDMDEIIKYIMQQVRCIASGDLTVEMEVNRRDEFHELAEHINEMTANMNDTVKEVRLLSEEVGCTKDRVVSHSQEIADGSLYISKEITEVHKALSEQVNDVVQCVNKMDALSVQINAITLQMYHIKKIADDMRREINTGKRYMDTLDKNSQQSISSIKSLVDTIVHIQEKSNAIVVKTNKLILNASTGTIKMLEQEKGMVETDEIKNMVDESVSALSVIHKIIQEMNGYAIQALNQGKEVKGNIKSQERDVLSAYKQFEDMSLQVDKIFVTLEEVIEMVVNMEQSKAVTIESIENVSSATKQISDSLTVLLNKIECQKSSDTNFEELVAKMNGEIEEMEKAIKMFKIH